VIVLRHRINSLLSRLLPTAAYRRVGTLLQDYGYFGDFASWDEAARQSDGYDAQVILERVRDAVLKVKAGEARGERDSVLLDEPVYSFPVIAALLRAALQNDGVLSVLDVGGSLGSSYFQTRAFLPPLKRLEWSVVEQPSFVACGKEHFENDELTFFADIAGCLPRRQPTVVILSGVLQYLPEPYAFLPELLQSRFPTIVVDRTLFREEATDRLVIQRVPPFIYPASYPAWLFSRPRFLEFMGQHYDRLAEFESGVSPEFSRVDARLLGFVFTLKAAH